MIIFFSITVVTLLLLAILFYKSMRQTAHLENLLVNKQTELTQLHQTEEKLQQELTIMQGKLHHVIEDPLTRLLGWTLFDDRVRQSIQEGARYQFTLAILYIDINDFRMINEALGFETGDAVLNEVSKRLQTCIRQVDSVSRLAKDIFVVLLAQLGKPETAAVVSQRILESLMQPVEVRDQKLYITASIGISIYPVDGLDPALLFRHADEALMLAKEKGTQNYQFYQEKNYENSLRELKLSTGLKRDTFQDECEIYYQPIVHGHDKTIFCMEALLYWRHPELGLIYPNELFHCVEKHNKSTLAYEWLIKKSCQQFVKWKSLGFSPELLGISLSIRQLKNIQFIYRIAQILQECDFNPSWLMIEIEENISQTSFEMVEKGFNILKYQNIKLAVNHFGAGIFSIQDLKKLTVNYLKLDNSFINDIEQNPQTLELIRSMNLLAKSLSMQLIIQGVDKEKQMNILADLGCDLMQGQFAGEPSSEENLVLTL